MDKQELIFPGIILGVVAIVAVGLLITHSSQKPPLSTGGVASSTASTTSSVSDTVAFSTSTNSDGHVHHGASTGAQVATPKYYYPYGTVTLGINQAAGFRNGVAIRPLEVLEDSRCPAGVMCIQAGTVKISVRAKTAANATATPLTLALGEATTYGGLTITLTSVEPLRTQGGGTPSADQYRFTFKVEPVGVSNTHGTGSGTVSSGPCYVGGCSSELCSDAKGQVSSCMYTAAYACYRTAHCERQAGGACGWTQTSELARCLANPPANS